MAYMDQTKKAELAPSMKAILKKYGMKGTVGVRNHSTLVCSISSGPIDIIGNMFEIAVCKPDSHYNRNPQKPTHLQVNEHWISDHYTGKALAFLSELCDAMNVGNHDRSDIQTDYFDVGWYLDINVGKWDKPYLITA
jgi:hypothetical protein